MNRSAITHEVEENGSIHESGVHRQEQWTRNMLEDVANSARC